jgi:hypothetical protein
MEGERAPFLVAFVSKRIVRGNETTGAREKMLTIIRDDQESWRNIVVEEVKQSY